MPSAPTRHEKASAIGGRPLLERASAAAVVVARRRAGARACAVDARPWLDQVRRQQLGRGIVAVEVGHVSDVGGIAPAEVEELGDEHWIVPALVSGPLA